MKIQRFPTGAKATPLAGISRLHQGKAVTFALGFFSFSLLFVL
jgi:hypothetical protein